MKTSTIYTRIQLYTLLFRPDDKQDERTITTSTTTTKCRTELTCGQILQISHSAYPIKIRLQAHHCKLVSEVGRWLRPLPIKSCTYEAGLILYPATAQASKMNQLSELVSFGLFLLYLMQGILYWFHFCIILLNWFSFFLLSFLFLYPLFFHFSGRRPRHLPLPYLLCFN